MYCVSQSYEELIELASKGNDYNLNSTIKDMAGGVEDQANEADQNMYSSVKDAKTQRVLYFFGKAIGSKPGQWKYFSISTNYNQHSQIIVM